MFYFVVSATYSDPLPVPTHEVDALLPAHKEFIKRGVENGKVLCAGPKNSGLGGFIVVKDETREALEEYIATDPYFQKGILQFEITEFSPYDFPAYLEAWVK